MDKDIAMHPKLAVFAFAALVLTACAHQKPVAAVPPSPASPAPEVAAVPPAPAAPPAAPLAVACSSDLQCSSDQLCAEGACATITPSLAACGLARVHFDFDQDLLHPAEFPVLQRMSRCIQANQPAQVLITGNADERGTVEYNLALGQRRAFAVRKYLGTLGVVGTQLRLVSYGKELPICTEHDEACWRENRRAGVRPGATPLDLLARIKTDERREKSGAAK